MSHNDDAENMLDLPGVELAPEIGASSPLRIAVQKTLEALNTGKLLEPRHAAVAQLALELADAVTAGRRSGRASAVAMASAQLLAALDALPKPAGLDADAEWNKFVEELHKVGASAPNHANGGDDE